MRALTLRNYAGYALGDVANNLVFSLQSFFLLIYYTNVVGLDPAAVATMMLVIRVWMAFADLIAGRLVDSATSSRWGKFHPWILFGSLPLLLVNVAVFTVPDFGGSSLAQYVWAYATYAASGFLYSMVTIPYGALATAMTQHPVERARLGVWRGAGPLLMMLLVTGLVAPQITRLADRPAELQALLTLLTALSVPLGVAMYAICVRASPEAAVRASSAVSIRASIGVLGRNRPLMVLCASHLVFLTGTFATMTVQSYYATYVLGDSASMVWLVGATAAASVASFAVVPRLVAAVGKKGTFLIGAAGVAAFGSLVTFLPPLVPVVTAAFAVLGLFQGLAMSFAFAFASDVADYGEWSSSVRSDGAVFAVYSFSRKISQALAGGLAGYALALGGFTASTLTQSDAALWTIRALVGVVPGALALVGGLIFLAYPLGDARYGAIMRELAARDADV